jgi:hypothetical protein
MTYPHNPLEIRRVWNEQGKIPAGSSGYAYAFQYELSDSRYVGRFWGSFHYDEANDAWIVTGAGRQYRNGQTVLIFPPQANMASEALTLCRRLYDAWSQARDAFYRERDYDQAKRADRIMALMSKANERYSRRAAQDPLDQEGVISHD